MTISKIKSGSIQDGTIESEDIASNTITGPNMAPGATEGNKIAPGTLTNSQISPSAAIANSKLANSSITLNDSAVSLGGTTTISAGADWQAVVVADGSTIINAVEGRGYFIDTNSGVVEVVLPSSPSLGDTINIVDYGGNFNTNNVILNTGSNILDSSTQSSLGTGLFPLDKSGASYEIVYSDSNRGWIIKADDLLGTPYDKIADGEAYGALFTEATGGTVTTSGNFKIHTFTGDGCFAVTQIGNACGGTEKVSYMVVAGGGAGGRNHGGSGGAGGFREGKVSAITDSCYTASPLNAPDGLTIAAGTTYPITVGGGGASQPIRGGNGSTSTFSTISSAGGGGGGGREGGQHNANSGGSGGGGAGGLGTGNCGTTSGGSGNSPPVSPPQGNPGNPGGSPADGGRGGSASAPGGSRSGSALAGVCSSITGSTIGYSSAAGGGGFSAGSPASPSDANRGASGYGGHQSFGPGQAGGKGVVVIRYRYQ